MTIAMRVSDISISFTFKLKEMVKEMQSQGVDIIRFDTVESNFETPMNVKKVAIQSIENNFTKYTDFTGIAELKSAVINKLQRDSNLFYSPSEILISNGSKHSIFNAIMSLVEEGDEVILFAPMWSTFFEQVKIARGTPIVIDTKETNSWQPEVDLIKQAITKRTKLIILNSPSNPSGAVFSKDLLEQIAKIAIKQNIYVISDECHESFVYPPNTHFSIASLSPEIRSLTITVNSLSKTYSMTGWRIGYSAGSELVINAMSKLQMQSSSNPNSIAQKAAVEALNGSKENIAKLYQEMSYRREIMVAGFNKIKEVHCAYPAGTPYTFPNMAYYLNTKYANKIIATSLDLSLYLLEHASVAIVPGVVFGDKYDSYFRVSFASSTDQEITRGIQHKF